MFLTPFITFCVALAAATVLLVVLGHRIRFASRILGILLGLAIAAGAGEVAARVWRLPATDVLVAQAVLVGLVTMTALLRPRWNPLGQMFFGVFLAAAGSYVAFATYFTFAGDLSVAGFLASLILLVLEVLALTLAGYFVFEGCDVVCRTRPTRPPPAYDPSYLPLVSLQVPAYNEPPDMLIDTIRSLEAIDYPNLEILVIDNNTEDPATWRPVEEYCRDRPRVRFLHKEGLDGFKAGALNYVMAEELDPSVELIGIVDADYRVDPRWLKDVVGYFVDPQLAFVQTPQHYRDWEGDPYLSACYDAYNYFFVASMPFRNQRNSIIFAGTMGLIRRSALEEIGRWPEWCITEDAETSLRLLKAGYSGHYVPAAYGEGIMPLTFAAFKSQRFRWAFGGIQILRRHLRSMLPGPRTRRNRLSLAQRFDYMLSGFMWFNDLLYLGFALILMVTAGIVLSGSSVQLRPLRGAIVLLPTALILSGVVRALWSLRVKTGIGLKRAAFAFLNWLSLSWTVALACLQHLFGSQASFLRTPKEGEERTLRGALRAARTETVLAALLWGTGIAVAASGHGTVFLVGLFAWQGLVYASGPIMSWLNVRAKLTPELERRRRTEYLRERVSALVPYYVGAAGFAIALVAVLAWGAGEGGRGYDPFRLPDGRPPQAQSPFDALRERFDGEAPAPEVTSAPNRTFAPLPTEQAPAPTPVPEPTSVPSAAPTTAPSAAPTAAPTATPAPAEAAPTAVP